MTRPSSHVRVLVVDDEPPIRSIVRGFLEREGMHVDEAADGPGAVEMARTRAPDVVVLDIMLPGFDGLEAIAPLLGRSLGAVTVAATNVAEGA